MRFEKNGKHTEIIVEEEDLRSGDPVAIIVFACQTFWAVILIYAFFVAFVRLFAG